MSLARFVIRLDDICPTMDHTKFALAKTYFDSAGVRPLLGVVPDNQDPDLVVDTPDPAFWETMRTLQAKGWSISQHGYQHRINSADRGLLGISPRSEFAGRSFDEQKADLAAGQAILEEHGIGTDIFMAPFHSYDEVTLAALKTLGFTRITDGYGIYPWQNNGLTFVPQLFERPVNFGVGLYTMCLHLNNMRIEEIEALGQFVTANSRRFLDFDRASDRVSPVALTNPIGVALRLALTVKRRLQ